MASRVVAGRGRTTILMATLLALLLAAAFLLAQHGFTSTALRPKVEPSTAEPAAPPTPPWTAAQLQDLLDAVRNAGSEGLRPRDYTLDQLQGTVDQGQSGAAVDKLADAAAAALAHDYATGRIRNRHRFNWYIDYAGPDASQLAAMIAAAREKGELKPQLAGLLPTSAEYRGLRAALAATPESDESRRDRIKANLERWRWLPRDFGRGDQLYINLPTYQVKLIRSGQTVASYKAVIGATNMPTPVLSSPVRQVIANPDWIVPQSIVRKSHLRPSSRYKFSTRPDGTVRVRQEPGPGNALGRLKIEFPNKLAIYFHDTPSRSLFGADARTFSHGCVRVQNIEELAASIVNAPARLTNALAGTSTRGLSVIEPLGANIVYFTLVPDPGGFLVDVGDPYKMDEPLAAALTGRKPAKASLPEPVLPAQSQLGPLPRPKPSGALQHRAPTTAGTPPATQTTTDTTPATVPVPTMPVPIPMPAPAPVPAPAPAPVPQLEPNVMADPEGETR